MSFAHARLEGRQTAIFHLHIFVGFVRMSDLITYAKCAKWPDTVVMVTVTRVCRQRQKTYVVTNRLAGLDGNTYLLSVWRRRVAIAVRGMSQQ